MKPITYLVVYILLILFQEKSSFSGQPSGCYLRPFEPAVNICLHDVVVDQRGKYIHKEKFGQHPAFRISRVQLPPG